MNLSGASTGLLYDCATHDSQCFRSEQKVPARANWLPARPIELSLGLARLTELAIRARQSCELHRSKGKSVSLSRARISRTILPSIVVRFYIFGIKEKLFLTNG